MSSDQDHVLALSDWSKEKPKEGLRTLMRGSEWYAVRKGNAQSILGAAKAGKLKDSFDREKVRMPPTDLSDVAYDAFLITMSTHEAPASVCAFSSFRETNQKTRKPENQKTRKPENK